MSTRYLQQLLQLKRIVVWCPEESKLSTRRRFEDWFEQHPPKSQISFIDGPEITKDLGSKDQTLLILVATSSSLPRYVEKLAKKTGRSFCYQKLSY
jgi:glycerol-3-phosphate dehydrogenase